MNDADKKAFKEWYKQQIWGNASWEDGVFEGFEFGLEWRDSQVGEPVGYTNEFQIEYVKNEAIGQGLMWATPNDESIPVFTTPPAAQINQQLVEFIQNWLKLQGNDDNYMTAKAKAALAATQMRGDA